MRNRTYAWVRDHRKCVDKIIRLNAELKLLTEIEVKKARREGWEQAKSNVMIMVQNKRHEYRCDAAEAAHRNFTEQEKSYLSKYKATADLFYVIAAMEYVEKTNER